VADFVNEPHAAIAKRCFGTGGAPHGGHGIVGVRERRRRNLRDRSEGDRQEIARVITMALPSRHWVEIKEDVNPAHLRKVLLKTYEANPQNYEQLLAVPGVGPKSVRALALVADVVYGSPASMRDPARFSFAHGGKDGHPYPVNATSTISRSIGSVNQ